MFGFGKDDDRDERQERREQPDYGSGQYGGGNIPHGGAYPPRAGVPADDDDDLRGAAEHAERHAGASGDRDVFSSVLGSLVGKKQQLANEDVDEQAAVHNHKKFFGGDDDGGEADSNQMGAAAAMQALKMFSGGQSGGSGSGSGSQSQFIGLAMSEASKLFDQQASQGKVSSGSNKESAVMQAGEMALKFYMKGQGGSSGGSSGLMSLASKFLS